jgi:mRNA-degrading endonuclease RelE of RelBE toxin-antitoxin system
LSERANQIAWPATARRDITKLPEKVATAAVEFLYGPVADNPHRMGAPLKLGLEGLYSARRGDHRIIYAIDDEARVVQVITIGHRSDVYRKRGPQ